MFVLLFGVLFSGSSNSKVSVGFVDQDQSIASRGIQTALSGDKVPLTLQVGSLDAEKAAMQRGDVSAIIVVPAGLQTSLAAKTPVALAVLHGSDEVARPRRWSRASWARSSTT